AAALSGTLVGTSPLHSAPLLVRIISPPAIPALRRAPGRRSSMVPRRTPCLRLALTAAVLLLAAAGARAGEKGEAASPLFRPPQRPAVPAVKDAAWVATPVDAFVLAKLEAQGLTPSKRADKLRLL